MTFKPYSKAFIEESTYRKDIVFDSLCRYGVKPLDDAMRAIARNELIIIAASSGYGKSELAISIARHNALKGKKVAHYNLEGGWREVIQRMKWRDICDIYYKNKDKYDHSITLDYRKWVLNETKEQILIDIEQEVYADLKEKLDKNLFFYDNPAGLTCDDFCASLLDFHSLITACGNTFEAHKRKGYDLDLIVIDHLHYFSLEKEEDEIHEITEVLKKAKHITEALNIPVIIVAHLKKLVRGHGIPDKEDIYGTSNIHKIANTCIILHPDHQKANLLTGIYPTFFRLAKSRQGLPPNILIKTNFDTKKRNYEDNYNLYACGPAGDPFEDPIHEDDCPKWYDGERKKEIQNERKDIS